MTPAEGRADIGDRRELDRFVETRLPAVLPGQRWFASKGRRIAATSVLDAAPLGGDRSRGALTLVEVAFDTGPAEIYAVPLALRTGAVPREQSLGMIELDGHEVHVVDAFDDEEFCQGLLGALVGGATLASRHGTLRFSRTAEFPVLPAAERFVARRVGAEQSNTSVAYGDALLLKAFRKLVPGTNLDYEMSEFLTSRGAFAHTPALAGSIHYAGRDRLEATLAVVHRFAPNQGDGWAYVVAHLTDLRDFLARQPPPAQQDPARRAAIVREFSVDVLLALRRLGAVTGALHAALASDAIDPAFAPEPITSCDAERWIAEMAHDARLTLAMVRERLDILPVPAQPSARVLLASQAELLAGVEALRLLAEAGCHKIRTHGDYHLGQTLRAEGDFLIIDFEGEPARPMAERRAKRCPLRDVAGMMRSLDYAVAATLAGAEPAARGELHEWGETWTDLAATAFLEGYRDEITRAPVALLPSAGSATARVLSAFIVEKALYEVRYEMDNRPAWAPIPIEALRRLLIRATEAHGS